MSIVKVTGTRPYEFVVNFTGKPMVQPKREKIVRTKTGCLNCRKRKRKCDEKKPGCTWCTTKGIPCSWPSDGKKPTTLKLIHYTPTSGGTIPGKISTVKPDSTRPSIPLDDEISHSIPSPESSDICIVPLDASTADQDIEIEATVDRRRSSICSLAHSENESHVQLSNNHTASSFNPFDFFGQVLHTNQILLPSQKDKFMSAAINGFIVSIGPQCTHPLLTTSATFTPMIPQNGVLSSIAEACGSSYLSWSNPDLLEFSHQKYMRAFTSVLEFVQENGYKEENEVWLTCACQLLCLGAKSTWGCNRAIANKNLRMSYEIIRRKMKRLVNEAEMRTDQRISTLPTPMEPSSSKDELDNDLIKNGSLKMDIENALIGYADESDKWSQFERMFIESFVYNYSVTILTTPTEEGLPNPFEVFRETRRYLKTPLFSCEVPWMNNPVTGASFDSYELAAKASYLIRHASEPWTYQCACKMLEMTKYYPPPVVPHEFRHDTKYQALKDSVAAAELVMTAAKIILKKLIDPSLQGSDPTLQKEVQLSVKKFKSVPAVSMIRGILSWALFVIGLACEEDDDRADIIKSCFLSAELVHGRHFYTIIDSLEASWGRHHLSENFRTGSRGLDVLLDIDFLQDVFL